MKTQDQNAIREDLSPKGRRLLQLVVNHVGSAGFTPADQTTYLGYKYCCVALGAAPADADLQWGRLLQRHGLTDLNEWTKRHDFPRVTGLIVNQGGDRKYWPGGDYFESNGRPDMDGPWWDVQAQAAVAFDWQSYL